MFGRFDDCGISPLTVKALTSAGYVKMTRVQEVALSVCLEGQLASCLSEIFVIFIALLVKF